jgi:oxygen tolerance protein BatD
MEVSMHRRVLFFVLIASLAGPYAFADSPSVTAVLNTSEAAVGETVKLQIKVTGGRDAEAPERIDVDGLEIYRTGKSQQFEMHNFDVTSSVIYEYTVLPSKAGTFRIPPQTIRVGGNALRTPELVLNVAGSSGRSSVSRPGRGAQSGDVNKIAFAELIVPTKTAFVGEMVPVEIRLGFDPRSHPKLTDGPEIAGQGFTTQKLHQSSENLETLNGRTYDVVTFKTAVAAAHSGKFELGPVKAKAQVLVPQSRRAPRSRSRLDPFDLNDPFSDPFFSDPFGQLAEPREVEIQSDTASFDVKPLPPNAPSSFSGAVGNFTMTTEAKPTKVQVGDPITITSTVTGRGNFDRLSAPAPEDDRGWHTYPPSSKFKQDDEVGISGTKTFETVISPNEKQRALPPLVFSYFDPVKEKYVTLQSEAIPVQVEGGAVASSRPEPPSPQPGSPIPATTAPTAASKPQDILYQLTQLGSARSFTPIYEEPVFWMAQVGPLLALFGFVGWKIRQAKIDNREAQRIAALHQESAALLRKLRRTELSPQEYFSDASRAVRIKTALVKNVDPNAVDAETAAAAFQLDENSRERLRRLFACNDELRYSGRPNGAGTISPQDQHQVLELIENLRA